MQADDPAAPCRLPSDSQTSLVSLPLLLCSVQSARAAACACGMVLVLEADTLDTYRCQKQFPYRLLCLPSQCRRHAQPVAADEFASMGAPMAAA